jgi:hypothetical protein
VVPHLEAAETEEVVIISLIEWRESSTAKPTEEQISGNDL